MIYKVLMFSIIEKILDIILNFFKKKNKETQDKKNLQEFTNKSREIIEKAHKTGNLEEIRKYLSK